MTAWLIVGAILMFAMPGILFYLLQHRLVFSPRYYPRRSQFVERSQNFHLQKIEVAPSIMLEGVVYEPDSPSLTTVLYFGGKEQDSVALVGKYAFRYPDVRFVSFNYRGYGISQGRPSHETLYDDALAVYDRVREQYGDIGLLGYSLGASVAAYVASRRRPEWVVLVSAFVSVERLVKEHFPFVPRGLIRWKYDTEAFVREIRAPLYLFASDGDRLVPRKHGLKLKECAQNLALYKEFSGYNHNELLFSEAVEAELEKVFYR